MKYFAGSVIAALLGALLWQHYSHRPKPLTERWDDSVLNKPSSTPTITLSPLGRFADNEAIANASYLKLKPKDVMIGGLRPKFDAKKIRAAIGPPQAITEEPIYHDVNSEKDLPVKLWHYDGLSIHVLNGGVAQISVTSSKWPTGKGLKVGDTLERTVSLYGAPNEVRSGDLVYCWEPGTGGFCPLVISISSSNTVNAITNEGWPD
jgi:hypothetical protein